MTFAESAKQWVKIRARQTWLLFWKNMLLARRSVRSSVIQIVVPFLFILMLFIFQFAITANEKNSNILTAERNPARMGFGSYPICIRSKFSIGPCVRLAYTVSPPEEKSVGDTIVGFITRDNNIRSSEVMYFNSALDLDDYIYSHPNSTQGAYQFNVTRTGASVHLTYTIQYNQTETTSFGRVVDPVLYTLNPMVSAVESAIARALVADSRLSYNVDIQPFAHTEAQPTDVVVNAGPSLFFAALMFNFVVTLGRVVAEREDKLREGMNQMGLRTLAYWLSHLMMAALFNVSSVMVLIISGCIFQFRFFLKNDFGTYFFLFILFAFAMVPFAFVLSTLVSKAKTATSLGFVVYLLGIIVQIFTDLIYADSTALFWKGLFSLLPFVLLAKGISDIGSFSLSVSQRGMRWDQRFHNSSFPLVRVYNWLIFDFFFFSVLAWYLDNTVPSQFGVSKPLYFFLMPSYWTGKTTRKDREPFHPDSQSDSADVDESVRAELSLAANDRYPEDSAIRLYNLRKTFSKRSCCCSRLTRFKAVQGLSFHVDANTLFCLLGHNGAGKSTLFNMLTGLFSAEGEGLIFDDDIHSQMNEVRAYMGVCPQHDILWPELTSREHLILFCALKGLDLESAKKEAVVRLDEVGLLDVADKLVSLYSGGMRRRLSTAIAFCANPKIIFLDEPTTGMDPVSRRKVWNMIQAKKGSGRAIVLTTHSMEEADVLADNIGIVSHGRLSTIGTALQLKNKYGAGYVVEIIVEDEERANEFMDANLGVEATSVHDDLRKYIVDRANTDAMPKLFKAFEKAGHEASGIRDIQVSLTTLESVFIAVSDKDEHAFAASVGKQVERYRCGNRVD